MRAKKVWRDRLLSNFVFRLPNSGNPAQSCHSGFAYERMIPTALDPVLLGIDSFKSNEICGNSG